MRRSAPLSALLLLVCPGFSCGDSAGGGSPADAGFEVRSGPPSPGEDGAPCSAARDCFGATCLTELEAGMPNGYCTAYNCTESTCHGGSCFELNGQSACLDPCNDSTDCRSGYICFDFGAARFCDLDGEPSVDVGESPGGECTYGCTAGDPVQIHCGYTPSREIEGGVFQWGLPYRLTQGVQGIALAVWAEGEDPESVNIVSARNAGGAQLALKGADSALNVTSFFDNQLAAVTIPFSPRYADFVSSASGLVQVQSTAESLCLLRAEGRDGNELTVHLYLVGASGLRIDTLADDPDFQLMLEELQRLLALAGIDLARVVPHAVDQPTVDAYRIVRDANDVRAVLAITEDPALDDGAGPEDALALNLVLVDDIIANDGSDTVGQAGLLPGPPGLHGFGVSGVLAETTSLRADPEYLALIIAHESAHFLGLRHTTELFLDTLAFGRTDPLEDTRECPDVLSLLEGCPDYRNLMFPLAPSNRDAASVELSVDQGWVLRHNPLLR